MRAGQPVRSSTPGRSSAAFSVQSIRWRIQLEVGFTTETLVKARVVEGPKEKRTGGKTGRGVTVDARNGWIGLIRFVGGGRLTKHFRAEETALLGT